MGMMAYDIYPVVMYWAHRYVFFEEIYLPHLVVWIGQVGYLVHTNWDRRSYSCMASHVCFMCIALS